MQVPDFSLLNDLYLPASAKPNDEFEKEYLVVREKEQRIYSDDQVRKLPDITRKHPHFKEWLIRRKSCRKLIRYLESKKSILNILEIGCGNGWFSYHLSRIPGSKVIALDINLTELQQAARVFGKNSKLKFIFGDIRSGILKDLKFDIILFAASIQYFADLHEIIDIALAHLIQNGEIHLIDSHFYHPKDIPAARERTRLYYQSLGIPDMKNHYYHHSITELSRYQYKVLFNPETALNRFFGSNPFFWICVKNV
jgi:SAM-dependent methyltransferase